MKTPMPCFNSLVISCFCSLYINYDSTYVAVFLAENHVKLSIKHLNLAAANFGVFL